MKICQFCICTCYWEPNVYELSVSFISDLCQIVHMKGTFLYKLLKLNEILHDKDLIWSTGMALRMKIRSFVHNYFIMTLKVASLNSFFSKPLILLFYFFVVVESELFWSIFFKDYTDDVVSAKFLPIEPVLSFFYSISFLRILCYIRNERKRSMWSINGLCLRFWNWIDTIKHTIVQLYLYSTVVKLVILYDSTSTVCVSTK